jgi:hypothetical protein
MEKVDKPSIGVFQALGIALEENPRERLHKTYLYSRKVKQMTSKCDD